MKQDEIIEMARQAGFEEQFTRPQDAIVRKGFALSGEFKGYKANNAALKAFAKLVAAKEREACEKRFMQLFLDHENQPTQFGTATQEYRELEIKIERELCVKAVADALYGQDGCYKAMRAIRARGEA